MQNPWLNIPLHDYEGHMSLPIVAQAALLADIFEGMLKTQLPESVAVLGCAGGNGFDRIDSAVTKRVVGIDINPDYITATRSRFADRLSGLELVVGDVQSAAFSFSPVELIFAALLFEYVDLDSTLKSIRRLLCPNGRLVTVLQLPKTDIEPVTPTPFITLQSLAPCLRFVSPDQVCDRAAAFGFRHISGNRVCSHGGKVFEVQTFQMSEG